MASDARKISSIKDEITGDAPGGGIIGARGYDLLKVPPNAWANGRNVRFTANGTKVRKVDGYSQFDTTPGNEAVRAMFPYAPLVGPRMLTRIGTTKAWVDFGGAIAEIATGLTGTVDNVVTVDQYKELLIWTDGLDDPQKWSGAGMGGPLLGTPPKAKIVVVHQDRVNFFNITNAGTEQPWRHAYSAIGVPEDFTGPTAGDLDYLETQGGIVAAGVQGNDILVYKDDVLHRAIFVGEPYNYIERPIPSSDGAVSARAFVAKGPYHYAMGTKGFWRIGAYPEEISNRFVQLVVDSVFDRTRKHLVFAYERPDFDEIVWKLPVVDNAGAPTFDVVYNTVSQTWSFWDHTPGYSYVRMALSIVDSWDGGEDADWDTGLDIDWDWSQTFGNAVELIGQADGKLQALGAGALDANGAAIAAYLESGFFVPADVTPTRILRVPLIAKGKGSLAVQIRSLRDERDELTVPFGTAMGFSLDVYGKPWVDVRSYGRLHQLRFSQNELGGDFEIDAYGYGVVRL